jgi:hypothetical protein
MLSFACVLERVGYDKLLLEALAEPRELLRAISGTTAILCDLDDCDDVEVRTRSPDGRSRGQSPSVSSLAEVEERVLRDLELLCRCSRSLSRSLSLSRSRSLLLGLLGSFLLRRRCVSDELMVYSWVYGRTGGFLAMAAGRVALEACAGKLHPARLRPASIGRVWWACRAARLSASRSAIHLGRWAQECKQMVNVSPVVDVEMRALVLVLGSRASRESWLSTPQPW